MREFREWVQLVFIVVGGVVALFAYAQNLRQRRVENALKFIALFRDGLEEGDMAEWVKLLRSSSECAGAAAGTFASERGDFASIGEYFSEGSEDGYAISRMAQSLDVVCHQVMSGVADARTVFYELGQLLRFMNYQLGAFNSPLTEESFLKYACPSIHAFFAKYGEQAEDWPSRVYAYVE